MSLDGDDAADATPPAPFQLQPAPNPEWTPGTKQPLPFANDAMLPFDPKDLKSCYPLMISAVVPRPIAFVSSLSADGVGNLSPFSYATVISHDPPCVMFSACRKPGGAKKDTWANIEATKEFVVCVMSEWFVNAANHTCGNFDAEDDEFDLSGLTRVPSAKVKPPRVKESAFHMECKLRHSYDVTNADGVVTATAIVGEVVMFHIHEAVANVEWEGKPRVDMARYAPVCRLGGDTYGRVGSGYDLPRPDRPAAGR